MRMQSREQVERMGWGSGEETGVEGKGDTEKKVSISLNYF